MAAAFTKKVTILYIDTNGFRSNHPLFASLFPVTNGFSYFLASIWPIYRALYSKTDGERREKVNLKGNSQAGVTVGTLRVGVEGSIRVVVIEKIRVELVCVGTALGTVFKYFLSCFV